MREDSQRYLCLEKSQRLFPILDKVKLRFPRLAKVLVVS